MIGERVTVRGICGQITRVVKQGDRFPKDSGKMTGQPYFGASFVVIQDDEGCSHHALLSEVA